MALLPILNFPDPRLRTRAKPIDKITDDIRTLASDMLDTMYAAPGVGLAASQVDRHLELIVMDISEDKSQPMVFINPKVIPLGNETAPYEEGCLSIPEIYDKVERSARVRIEALDLKGQPISLDAEGLLAVCIQHEMDHLSGKLFVDYLSPLKRQRIKDKLVKREREKVRVR